MKKKLSIILVLCILLVSLTGCRLTDTLGITTSLKPPTEQEVLTEVANIVDKENYTLTSTTKLTKSDDIHSGYRYWFSSNDRDLKFTAIGAVKHYSDGWSYYEQDIDINYWDCILDSYEDEFKDVLNKYYTNLKPVSGDMIVNGWHEIRLPIKNPEDIDTIVSIYEELNTIYSAEQKYHANTLDTYQSDCFWEVVPYIYAAGEAKYIKKRYSIDASSENIKDEIYSAVCEIALNEEINLTTFDLEGYVSDTGFNKSSFSDIWIDNHKMTFKESAGVTYTMDDLVQYDDINNDYYVRLCEINYDANGTNGMSAQYSTLSHYFRAIHDITGMDYYVDFVSEGNKDKIYNGGDAITTFEYTLDNNNYLITFTTDCYNSTTTITVEQNSTNIPIRYEDATGLGCVFINIDDFCSLLGLTYQIEQGTKLHFYTK